MTEIGNLKQGNFFLWENETYLVLWECPAHPKCLSCVKLNGAGIFCWSYWRQKEVTPLESVTIHYGDD